MKRIRKRREGDENQGGGYEDKEKIYKKFKGFIKHESSCVIFIYLN